MHGKKAYVGEQGVMGGRNLTIPFPVFTEFDVMTVLVRHAHY